MSDSHRRWKNFKKLKRNGDLYVNKPGDEDAKPALEKVSLSCSSLAGSNLCADFCKYRRTKLGARSREMKAH